MRDIILTLAFAGILPFALKHTWIGVLLWTWMSIMNPHRLAYGFAMNAPFAMVAAGATLVSGVIGIKKLRLPANATVFCLISFVLWMCITTANAIHPEGSLNDLIISLKIQLMTLVAIMALRERKHIEAFIWVIVVSVGFYGVKGGLFTIASGGGYRVWGPANTFIEGNNELALAIIMTVPLMNYLRLVSPYKWVRLGLMFAMLMMVAAALGSQSRGGFLAAAAMGLMLWMRSRRKAVGGIFLVIVATGLLMFMPESWETRMRSIGTYQEDSSAMQRINAWGTAFNIANDRITGGGFLVETPEVAARYSDRPEWVFTAHSIYFQALGEQGWIGLALFLGIGLTAFLSTMRLRKISRQQAETLWLFELGGMLQVAFVGYAVGGAFLSLTYLDIAYNLIVIVIVAGCWLNERRWSAEPTGLFKSGMPVGKLKLASAAHE